MIFLSSYREKRHYVQPKRKPEDRLIVIAISYYMYISDLHKILLQYNIIGPST